MNDESAPKGAHEIPARASTPTIDAAADLVRKSTMTKAERAELATLARIRGKLAKDQVDTVAAERIAEAEAQLSAIFSSEDALWRDATAAAKAAIDEVNRVITEQWAIAGQPPTFAPQAYFAWLGRGENASKERRAELRAALRTRVGYDAKNAKARIEAATVEIRTELIRDGLTSAGARAFLDAMPVASALLPQVDVEQLQGRMTSQQVARIESGDTTPRWFG